MATIFPSIGDASGRETGASLSSEVSSGSQVVLDVRVQDVPQTALIDDDHVMEEFAPNGCDQPLRVAVLPG